MSKIRIRFFDELVETPLNGTHTFTRALRQELSRKHECSVVDEPSQDYDVLFVNQIDARKDAEAEKIARKIRGEVGNRKKRKLVLRAVQLIAANLKGQNGDSTISDGLHLDVPEDLIRMADFVIFQSAFQRDTFARYGFDFDHQAVVHNGAANLFMKSSPSLNALSPNDNLLLISSSMSTHASKRHDLIASFSLLPLVQVVHCGVWPVEIDRRNVNLAGVLSPATIAELCEAAHYFLHPAIQDICPNSLVEGLCAGLPAIYHPGPGSGNEIAGNFGIALDETDLEGTIARARRDHNRLATALAANRRNFSIECAAQPYLEIFRAVATK